MIMRSHTNFNWLPTPRIQGYSVLFSFCSTKSRLLSMVTLYLTLNLSPISIWNDVEYKDQRPATHHIPLFLLSLVCIWRFIEHKADNEWSCPVSLDTLWELFSIYDTFVILYIDIFYISSHDFIFAYVNALLKWFLSDLQLIPLFIN